MNKSKMLGKIKGVGILFLLKGSGKKDLEPKVVLRRRGLWNWETDSPESWRNSFQVSCHGYLESGEDFMDCLARELKEELGFSQSVIRDLLKRAKELVSVSSGKKVMKTFFCEVSYDLLAQSPAQDSLIPVTKEQARSIKLMEEPLSDGSKPGRETIFPNNEIRMWPDEREAVWKASSQGV